MLDELIPLFAIFFTIGVPVMALATHFVLRPLVRDIIGAIRTTKTDEISLIQQRLTELEEGQHNIQLRLEQLVEAERFRQQLESGSSER